MTDHPSCRPPLGHLRTQCGTKHRVKISSRRVPTASTSQRWVQGHGHLGAFRLSCSRAIPDIPSRSTSDTRLLQRMAGNPELVTGETLGSSPCRDIRRSGLRCHTARNDTQVVVPRVAMRKPGGSVTKTVIEAPEPVEVVTQIPSRVGRSTKPSPNPSWWESPCSWDW